MDSLQTYRDVISIDEREKDLLHFLQVINNKIRRYDATRWVGITTPRIIGAPAGHCIWVQLENPVFGAYWYKIRSIKFKRNEVILSVVQVRPVQDDSGIVLNNESDSISYDSILQSIKIGFKEKMSFFAKEVVTFNNAKSSVLFLGVLFMTIFTGLVQLAHYLGDWSLRFMREFSYLLKTATPVLLSIINMFNRIVAGFYTLIALIWRDSKAPKTVYVTNQVDYAPTFNRDFGQNKEVARRRALPPTQYYQK